MGSLVGPVELAGMARSGFRTSSGSCNLWEEPAAPAATAMPTAGLAGLVVL
jgi:hypothetical protein